MTDEIYSETFGGYEPLQIDSSSGNEYTTTNFVVGAVILVAIFWGLRRVFNWTQARAATGQEKPGKSWKDDIKRRFKRATRDENTEEEHKEKFIDHESGNSGNESNDNVTIIGSKKSGLTNRFSKTQDTNYSALSGGNQDGQIDSSSGPSFGEKAKSLLGMGAGSKFSPIKAGVVDESDKSKAEESKAAAVVIDDDKSGLVEELDTIDIKHQNEELQSYMMDETNNL